MRRIKFALLLGAVGMFYLSVTLLALILGLFAEALVVADNRLINHHEQFRTLVRSRHRLLALRWPTKA